MDADIISAISSAGNNVFYQPINTKDEESRWKMKLSDAFMNEDKSGDFEWTADVINMNPKCNEPLQKNCKSLYDYSRFVAKGLVQGASKKAMEDAENLLKMNVLTDVQISQAIGLPLEKVQKIAESLVVKA